MPDIIWVISENNEEQLNEIAKDWEIPLSVVKILWQRGYKTKEAIGNFLYPKAKNLLDPFLLPDLPEAVERIKKAVSKKERILLCGDYDVDGITSTALLCSTLKKIGADVDFYIPHRGKEGYGLSETAVLFAKSYGFSLIVTLDCGTTDFHSISLAKKLSIDVIVCDHHEPKDKLPFALAIINPKRKESKYPFSELTAVGVAFKLSWALLQAFNFKKDDLIENLDLVTLGTICDIGPLTNENRILTKLGLPFLSKTKRIGLKALFKVSGLKKKNLTAYDIGFIIGPRINASGRIACAEKAVKLLLTKDEKEAEILAKELNEYNRERQAIEAEILKQALTITEKEKKEKNPIILLAHKNWHEGVIGIVASRIVEEFYRPAIVITIREDKAVGSGRSIPNFHLFEAIKANSNHLLSFGGHRYACGLTIKKEHLKRFEEDLLNYALKHTEPSVYERKIFIDAILSLKDITPQLLDYLKNLEPFGVDNPEPRFATFDLEVVGIPRVIKKAHLKFRVRENKAQRDAFEVVALGHHAKILDLKVGEEGHLSIVYTIDENSFLGKKKIVLYAKDLKIKT